MITEKTMAGGWVPLANAFHNLDEDKVRPFFYEHENNISMDIWFFKPNNVSVFALSTNDLDFYLPIRLENIVPKLKD